MQNASGHVSGHFLAILKSQLRRLQILWLQAIFKGYFGLFCRKIGTMATVTSPQIN
jgi:hypothetical protein